MFCPFIHYFRQIYVIMECAFVRFSSRHLAVLSCLLICLLAPPLPAQPPKPEGTYRIGILGCHRQFEPAPALVRYLSSELDLALWIGDNIYADTRTDIGYLDSCYQALGAKPAFRQLMATTPYLATWDDHDYGDNDEWKDYPLKGESKALFRRFWHLEDQIPTEQPGIYYAQQLKVGNQQLQIILLDVRYNRDEPGPFADLLGEAQWTWLASQLRQPADLRLIVSGTQVLLDKESGSESWDQYPQAQARLFDLIRRSEAERVVFITGDQHYGEVCRLSGGVDYDVVELQFSGINQTENPEYNPLRVAPAAHTLHSYALLDLQFEPSAYDPPHLLFRVFDAMSNETQLTYRVNFSELTLDLQFATDTAFVQRKDVYIRHRYPQLVVRYTTDGQIPGPDSPLYEGPFELKETTTVRARLFDQAGFARSKVFTQTYAYLYPLSSVAAGPVAPGLRYRYVEGEFSQLPDFETQAITRSGIVEDLRLDRLAPRPDHFAVEYTGFIEVLEEGLYTFSLTSDDGSALYLHDRLLVDNNGSHSKRMRTGRIALKKGLHPIRLRYFEDYDGEYLDLKVRTQSADHPISFFYYR